MKFKLIMAPKFECNTDRIQSQQGKSYEKRQNFNKLNLNPMLN